MAQPEIPEEFIERVAETASDMAHEHCGEDGCTAGGMTYWLEVTSFVLAAAAEHAQITPAAATT